MQKITIRRSKHTFKVQNLKQKVVINPISNPKVTIKSSGKRGLPGPEGDEGKSAYQVWLDAGNTGTMQDFLSSLEGAPGAQGPQGASGGNSVIPFSGQTVTITHNLGYIPSLSLYDTAGDEIEGGIIEKDNNHFTVQFSASVSGTAYCS